MTSAPRANRTATIGFTVAVALIAAAIVVPAATGWNVWTGDFPPLRAEWKPRVGPGTIPSVVIAIMAARYAVGAAAQWSWRTLLVSAFIGGFGWLTSLALVDGPVGLGRVLDYPSEYLDTARAITDVPLLLREYISRIPLNSVDNWPTHIAGHPPGAVLFFWVLVQLGLGGWLAAGMTVIILASTTPVAVLITLRRLGAESPARVAAPYIVLGPAAVWAAVSADAMFAAVAAWGLCCLAISATSHRWWSVGGWGVAAGILLGSCVMLSYGLTILGLLAIAILIAAGNWRPMPWAVGAALAVILAFAFGGFAWWRAYPVLVDRYWDGYASRRPATYWTWANLASLAISAGPVIGAITAVVVAGARRVRSAGTHHRVVLLLVGAALTSVAIADISQMSKSEVERIWLPFIPWMLVGASMLPERWHRVGLITQLLFALLVQHLLRTEW